MPSLDFQKYCRDLSIFSDTINIRSSSNGLELIAEGDFARQHVRIKQSDCGITIPKGEITVEGKYSVKYLNLFTKSTNLSNVVELYLMNDYPLILVYHVGNLGKLQYCLAPKSEN